MVTKTIEAELKKITDKCRTPIYVYLEETLIENINRIKKAILKSNIKNKIKINVSYFANSNPHLISILAKEGVGITIQSPEENEQLKHSGLKSIAKEVSPTHLSKEDFDYFLNEGLKINIGTFANIKYALSKNIDKINVRVDLSPESLQRQGIKTSQFEELKVLLSKNKSKLNGIHIYPGTKNELDVHLRYQIKSLHCLQYFPEIKEINLGGGFNFDYEQKIENQHFNWNAYFRELKNNIEEFNVSDDVEFTIEPGRDILADAGFLLVKVNGIERVYGKELFEIFTDGSYVHLPSATVRERQHNLSFFDNLLKKKSVEKIKESAGMLNGNTTLSSDRLLPGIIYFPSDLKEEDFILLHDVGAYGSTQHMEFLNKAPCPEVLINRNKEIKLLTQRGKSTDKIRYLLSSPLNLDEVRNEITR